MNKKLNCILLIDDDEPTNYLNKKVIKELDCAENVVVAESGEKALAFLSGLKEDNSLRPELVFLDINMPAMNGWEFLEKYQNLPAQQRAEIVIVMLTTSLNPSDYEKSKEYESINDFKNKPLAKQDLENLLYQYFWKSTEP